jgi:hypothetical protein
VAVAVVPPLLPDDEDVPTEDVGVAEAAIRV